MKPKNIYAGHRYPKAGVVPFCRDSGKMKGKRSTWGGRAQVRTALYMMALSASKYNPAIKLFYERLIAKGKTKKVVLIRLKIAYEYNNMKKTLYFLFLFFFSFFIYVPGICHAGDEIIVPVSSETDISVEHFSSSGEYLILWLAPEYGFRPTHRSLAQRLSMHNIEIWQTNIAESLFLPQSLRSIKQLDGKYVADLIEYAYKTTGKKIIVAGDSYAAINVLRGVNQWQQRKQTVSYLIGAILFSPYAYAYIPQLGQPPQFMPIVSATNIPVMIYQAGKSGNIGQFEQLLEKLQQHNAPVYSQLLPEIMGLFYAEEPTPEIQKNTKKLPVNIKRMITALERHKLSLIPIPLKDIKNNKSGIDISLKKFTGKSVPLPIDLKNAHGNTMIKDNYKGQITVVNFWATWCPPCVEEIPSLNQLKMKMSGLPFELISINYAEDNKTILDFMKKINIEFPVLMDKNGDFAKKWNVITYPSTFIIDTNGQIKYGINAAIEWDSPEVIQTIKSLL